MECYLDNSATTRVFPQVAEEMCRVMTREYGNPSSMHRRGVDAENLVKEAQKTLAGILKCDAKNIYFTSGGTESDNLAILGCAQANIRRGKHLITTKIEHPAVLNTMKHLEEQGFSVTYLSVDDGGRIRLEELKNAITEETTLVSIMQVNNEIGSLQPIAEAGALIKECNPATLFHVDAVQGFGKVQIHPKKMNIDLLSISGHKIHGPKGMGVLYVGDKVKINPIQYGGGQQGGLRSGTDNVPGIVGISMAAKMLQEHFLEDQERLYGLKQQLIEGLLRIPGVRINGIPVQEGYLGAGATQVDLPTEHWSEVLRQTAPHVVSVSFPGVRAEVLLHTLEETQIYVSAGSACSSHKPQPSATLQAIRIPKEYLDTTLRFSLSVETQPEEIQFALQVLQDKLPILQRFTRH